MEQVAAGAGKPVQTANEVLASLLESQRVAAEKAKPVVSKVSFTKQANSGGVGGTNELGLPKGMTWVSPKGRALCDAPPMATCRQFVERGLVLLNSDKASEAKGLEVCCLICILRILADVC